MEPDPRLVDALRQLSAGQFAADDWLQWWNENAACVSDRLNRGQWLRLKPHQPGGYGPPCRCAFVSQKEAFNLLNRWGIEHERSDRYEKEWKVEFEKYVADGQQEQTRQRELFRHRLDCLKLGFPKLAKVLSKNLNEVVQLDEPATEEQIQQLEQTLGAKLPESYRSFLACTKALVYGDAAQIGLPYTFRHPDIPALPSAGQICFGEYWLEGDGDQVLFGDAESGQEPPILYYNHAEPSVRTLAESFTAWIESIIQYDQ